MFICASQVIFFIFVVGISGCVGVGLRIGQAQMVSDLCVDVDKPFSVMFLRCMMGKVRHILTR